MVAIDTCSLVALVRYYLPFDTENTLYNLIQHDVEQGEIIVIDKVFEQSKYYSKGIVIEALPYLKDNWVTSVDCLPDKTFFHLTNNDFTNSVMRRKLTDEQFEVQKQKFLEDADAKLILYCLRKSKMLSTIKIVTEETESSNDGKTFKKIPALGRSVGVNTLTLTEFLKEIGVGCSFE
jgi:thymidylate kinase